MSDSNEHFYGARGLERLTGLTDDIFAFAITLMVLNIVTPAVVGPKSDLALLQAIAQEYQSFIDLAVSFWVIGLLWIANHRMFRYIKSFDASLLSLSLLYLFFIVVVPFATRVLDDYSSLPTASTADHRPGVVISRIGFLIMPRSSPSSMRYASRPTYRWL